MKLSALHPYVYLATRYPFAKGQSSSRRICYMSSVYLVSEGKGLLVTEGNHLQVSPGSLVYLPPGQSHEWLADPGEPMVHLCCYFDWSLIDREGYFDWACPICYEPQQLLPEWLGPQFPYPLPLRLQASSVRVWAERFEKFYTPGQFVNEQTFIRNLHIQRNFQEFIDYFLHHMMLQGPPVPDRRINALLERIEQDLLHDAPRPLECYYRELKLSRGHFFELFRTSVGCSPVQYMNRFRISRAKEDLRHTSLSITAIAEKYHFSSVHYFSRLFHRETGLAPRDFRSGEGPHATAPKNHSEKAQHPLS